MHYAQIKYPQKLGTGPKAVSIATAGCFVTSFSNLLDRFGITEDPAALNQFFIDHGTYIVEGDGTRDLLAFSSITAFDGNVRITSQGKGSPTEDNSIVKFVYDGGKTHFCLVASAGMGTIVDSWDGVTKSWNAYGGPVAYASYTNAAAQPTTTAKSQARYAVVETYPGGKEVRLNKQPTHLWGMNYTFDYMVSHPVESHNEGEIWTVTNKVHHEDGMDYYRREGQVDGFNVVDCDDYTPPVMPTPPIQVIEPVMPTSPPAAPLKPAGNPDNTYEVIKEIPGYATATNAGNHVSQVNEVAPGKYYVYNVHPLNSDLVNVTSKLGQPGSWINKADNVPDAPEPLPEVIAVETPPEPVDWRTTYRPFSKPIHYISTRDQLVSDLTGTQPDMPLPKYNAGSGSKIGMVASYGTVTKDGVDYYRLKTGADSAFNYWYCVPKIDPMTRTPNLLVAPIDPIVPVSKVTAAKDAVVLVRSHLEIDVPKFLDDIIPKFLRNKK